MLKVAFLGGPPFLRPTSSHHFQEPLQIFLNDRKTEKVNVQVQYHFSICWVRLTGSAHPLMLFFIIIAFGGSWDAFHTLISRVITRTILEINHAPPLFIVRAYLCPNISVSVHESRETPARKLEPNPYTHRLCIGSARHGYGVHRRYAERLS